MRLRGIDFGPIWCASGALGFFGEGYWYHKWLWPLGLSWKNCTFVAKTTTLHPRQGNMPLKDSITPAELKPKCIVVKWRKGVVLNAVGLTGPGAPWLFDQQRWQARTAPFFLSFMSVEPTLKERLKELRWFVDLFGRHRSSFAAQTIGLQLNFSCPNVGLETAKLLGEVDEALNIASALALPLVPKFNVTIPARIAKVVTENSNCDGLCVSNTVPWGQLSDRINWRELFGSEESPLKELNGGGLSGWPLLPLVVEWLQQARAAGITKPINAGGGILCADDVDALVDAGANSVSIGSVAMLRWWRMPAIIRRARHLLNGSR